MQLAFYQILNLSLFCGSLGLSKVDKQDQNANLHLVRLGAYLHFEL